MCIFFQNFIHSFPSRSFKTSVDPDQLASYPHFIHMMDHINVIVLLLCLDVRSSYSVTSSLSQELVTNPLNKNKNRPSTLDKLLGQLGIYATWLSSIAYLQKQLRIFNFFYATFFSRDYTFSYCVKPSGMCLHIYMRTSSAFLKYQNSRFYCT